MEMTAVLKGLQALTAPAELHLFSDSKYVINGMNSWIHGWKRNRWLTKTGKSVTNIDLWKAIDAAAKDHAVTWKWVKGHAGHTENELCDKMAGWGRDIASNIDVTCMACGQSLNEIPLNACTEHAFFTTACADTVSDPDNAYELMEDPNT